jgi:biopolymer transport protein ExbD
MMNIYFIVTFVTVALAEINLPTARHVEPLDSETAVVLTLLGSLDGRGVEVRVGEGDDAVTLGGNDQEEQIAAAVEQGAAAGKTAVLIKAEKKVRLSELFRVATAAAEAEGLKLHVAVVETDAAP